MVSTLALMAVAATTPATFDATDFSQHFKKNSKATYEMKMTGGESGMDIEMHAVIDVSVTEVHKEGGATLSIHVINGGASFGGQEMPMEAFEDVTFKVDKHGAPTEVDMNGFTAIFYISMLTAYLPNKKLDEGDTYKAKLNMGDLNYEATGKYVGHGKFGGKEYSVLESKGSIDDDGDDPGEISTKLFFDKAKGMVVATESKIDTSDGEFDLVFKLTESKIDTSDGEFDLSS